MNMVHCKNNRYKNGEYNPNHSKALVREKAESIAPSQAQKEYRDALYKFCIEKGIIKSFPLGRTRQAINANIRAFISILRKHGLDDEFYKENDCEKDTHTICQNI